LRLTATDGSRGTLDAMELIFYIKNSKNKKNIRSIFIENPNLKYFTKSQKISEHSFSSMITMNEDFFSYFKENIFDEIWEIFKILWLNLTFYRLTGVFIQINPFDPWSERFTFTLMLQYTFNCFQMLRTFSFSIDSFFLLVDFLPKLWYFFANYLFFNLIFFTILLLIIFAKFFIMSTFLFSQENLNTDWKFLSEKAKINSKIKIIFFA
jgi:hypothetical protein